MHSGAISAKIGPMHWQGNIYYNGLRAVGCIVLTPLALGGEDDDALSYFYTAFLCVDDWNDLHVGSFEEYSKAVEVIEKEYHRNETR